ncbi:hypothetical protein D3C76_955780 [compost metagenome]
MPAAPVELQTGKIADEQPPVAPRVVQHVHGERLVRLGMREAADLVDAHRIALLGDEQALAGGVVGQPLETLVAAQADADGQLFAVGRVDEARAVVQAHPDQTLEAFVDDDVDARRDVFDRLRIAETGQRNPAQHAPIQGQLDDLLLLVGDAEQAAPVGIVGQRRDVVVQSLDGLPLDRHAVVRQPDRPLAPALRMAPLAQAEPGPLIDAVLLAEPGQRRQHDQQQDQQQAAKDGGKAGHGRLWRERGNGADPTAGN